MSSRTASDQIRQDANYCRDYRAWVESLSPTERRRLVALGLDKPDASRQIAGARDRVGLDTLDAIMHHHESPITANQDDEEKASDSSHIGTVADALAAYMLWVINPHPLGKGSLNPKAVAQRAIMAAWVLRPDMVKGRTLTDLAAILDTKPEVLSRQASSFSRRFGIKGRCQYSERTRSAMSRAKTRQALQAQQLIDLDDSTGVDPSRN